MTRVIAPIVLLASLWPQTVAFVPLMREFVPKKASFQRKSQQLNLIDPSSILIATIDSDIANIPENEFAPVFMGGLAVMAAGVLSALFVGTVIDQKNLYGQLVEDSFARLSSNDQEFWDSLDEQQRDKVRQLFEKLADEKEGKQALKELQDMKDKFLLSPPSNSNSNNSSSSSSSDVDTSKEVAQATKQTTGQPKEIGMFSDYAE